MILFDFIYLLSIYDMCCFIFILWKFVIIIMLNNILFDKLIVFLIYYEKIPLLFLWNSNTN